MTNKKTQFIKVSLFAFQKKIVLFASVKTLKNDEKCFLFHCRIRFCSQDISIFVFNFGHVKKTGLIIEVWLTLVWTRLFIIFIAEFEQAFHIIPYSLLTL